MTNPRSVVKSTTICRCLFLRKNESNYIRLLTLSITYANMFRILKSTIVHHTSFYFDYSVYSSHLSWSPSY